VNTMNARQISKLSMLTAFALIVFSIELQLPAPVPIPGVKLGLSNIVTLFSIYTVGRRYAGAVLFLRIVLGNLLCGQAVAMWFSIAGGLVCYGVMCFASWRLTEKQIWVVSILGAVGHNIGQMTIAATLVGASAVLFYLPVLLVSAILTGLFTGLCAQYVYAHLHRAFPIMFR